LDLRPDARLKDSLTILVASYGTEARFANFPTLGHQLRFRGVRASLLAGTNQVPLTFPGATHFAGGSSINLQQAWNGTATVNNNDARQQLSVNTCNACHEEKHRTVIFFKLRIEPRAAPHSYLPS
jgi:hypothetical protein